MTYEAIDLLYNASKEDVFGDRLALIVACSRRGIKQGAKDPFGVVHKIQFDAMPYFAQSVMEITHEVCPGLMGPSQIVAVNDGLKIVGFDSGCIVPVSNFGPKKTFNCHVRGRLEHHSGEVSCLASNQNGTKFASGCTSGTITLYQAREAEIEFLSKTQDTRSINVTHMSYYRPDSMFSYGKQTNSKPTDDSLLLYSSQCGNFGLLDTRCTLAEKLHSELMFVAPENLKISTFVLSSSEGTGSTVYLGSFSGDIVTCDLRMPSQYVRKHKLDSECRVNRLREVHIQSADSRRTFLAFTNDSSQLQVLDPQTARPDPKWVCERQPGDIVRDFVQVDDRLITCGDRTSIGCWNWDR